MILEPLFRMQLGVSDVCAEVIPWGVTEKYGRRAIVLLRKKGADPDADIHGIGFDENDPGMFFAVRMVKAGEEWECHGESVEGKSEKFLMTCVRVVAEAGHRLDWPLWTIFLKAQNKLGWDGKAVAKVLVVSAEQAQEILGFHMAPRLTPAEA